VMLRRLEPLTDMNTAPSGTETGESPWDRL
jgi:hypothetical protein